MRGKSIIAVVVSVLGLALWGVLKDTYFAVAIEEATDKFATWLDISRAQMISAATPFVLALGVIAVTAMISFYVGKHERVSFEPEPDIDPRKAFAAILKNKKWCRKFTETNPEKRQHLVSNYLAVRLKLQIEDALVQGRLQAWGRKNLAVFEEGPFDKIPAAAWHDAQVVFDFDLERRAVATTRVSKQTAYLGIKLNAKQIAKEFKISKRALQ